MMNWFAKMIFDGGGKQKGSATGNSWKYTSTKVCRFIKKQAQPAASRFRKLFEKLSLNAAHTGSILIEFAVCMPVLIILLYYVNDLSKLKRYYDQTEFVAQQMVNILQNISQNRKGENKKITRPDLFRAASLAYLSAYPGKTIYSDKKRGSFSHTLSHYPLIFIYYVEGLPDGKASCKWGMKYYPNSTTTPMSWGYNTLSSNALDSKITWGTNINASTIYPSLKIPEDKAKIIVECVFYVNANSMSKDAYVATDDQSARARKAFKCFLATPESTYPNSANGNYFNSVAIFSPASQDLFDAETPPQ